MAPNIFGDLGPCTIWIKPQVSLPVGLTKSSLTVQRTDLEEISVLLNNKRIPEDAHWLLVAEARDRARLILEDHRESALKLVNRLAEAGHVGDAEFLRLMTK